MGTAPPAGFRSPAKQRRNTGSCTTAAGSVAQARFRIHTRENTTKIMVV